MSKVWYCLRNKKDFQAVYRRGKSINHQGLVFKYLPNPPRKNFRFLVPKKVVPSVVKRNQLRRRLREIIRKDLNTITKNINGIFVVKKDLTDKNFKELTQMVRVILKRVDLTK